MFKNQLVVEIDVELAMLSWDQVEPVDVSAVLEKDFARYPSGSEGMLSSVAILDGNVQLVLCHFVPPTDWLAKSIM